MTAGAASTPAGAPVPPPLDERSCVQAITVSAVTDPHSRTELTVVPFSRDLAVAVVDLLAPRSSVGPAPATSTETDEILGGFTWPHPTFVALAEGRVIGYVEGQLDSGCADRVPPSLPGETGDGAASTPAECAWIDHIYVDPRHRRGRVAANLVVAFTSAAEAHGCDRIACLPDTSEGVAERLAFFRAVGLTAAPAANGGTLAGSVADVLQRARALAGH